MSVETTTQGILSNARIHPTIAVADLAAARTFYEGTLGLTPTNDEGDGGIQYGTGDTNVHVYPKQGATPSQNTVASFETDDLDATMAGLRDNGIAFEEYDLPDFKTDNGVIEMGDLRGCWFKDPTGNILGLFQR